MSNYGGRLVRAIKLDAELYEEVEADKGATGQAIATVVLSSLAAGLGGIPSGGLYGLMLSTLAAMVGWFIWAFLSYFIGTKLLPQPQTRSNLGELLRCTGFSSAPGLIQMVAIIPIPGLGYVVRWVAGVWMLIAFVLAVRQALDYTSTARALGVCIIGWLVLMALNTFLFMASFGQLTL